jgi:hypothetical protein
MVMENVTSSASVPGSKISTQYVPGSAAVAICGVAPAVVVDVEMVRAHGTPAPGIPTPSPTATDDGLTLVKVAVIAPD